MTIEDIKQLRDTFDNPNHPIAIICDYLIAKDIKDTIEFVESIDETEQ